MCPLDSYKFYKEENRDSKEKAIKEYKGIENNIHLIEKTLKIRDKVLKILQDNICSKKECKIVLTLNNKIFNQQKVL